MDQIEKFILKLDRRLAQKMAIALQDIVLLHLGQYDCKKMKGFDDLFRIRIGKIRVIFRKSNKLGIPIYIEYRGRAYKKDF